MDSRTLKDMAQEAIDVQDACNLSGVIYAWERTMERLNTMRHNGELPELNNTDSLNRHPINVMFASKVASLTHSEGVSEFSQAYNACHELASK